MTTSAGPTSPIPQVKVPAAVAAETASDVTTDRAGAAPGVPQPKGIGHPEVGRAARSRREPSSNKRPRARGKSSASAPLVVGGMPKVDLLPHSIRVLDQQRRARRTMRFAALGIVVIVVAGTGAAWYQNMTAQQLLADVQADSVSLLQQQTDYADLVDAKQQIEIIAAAQAIGGATDVDWRDYLAALQATLPDSVVIKTVTIDGATPGSVYEQSTTPLEGERVATLNFSAVSTTLPDVPKWLDGLRDLKAFVDATPNSVLLDETTGTYVVDITMHVSSDVYSHRFAATETDAQ